MTNPHAGIAVVNGSISLITEAKISLTDRGFLFGHAVFETILVSHGKIVALEHHLERLQHSCQRSLIKQPNKDELEKLALKAIEENISLSKSINPKMALRIIITGGNSLDLPIKRTQDELPDPNVILICRNIIGPTTENYTHGINLKSLLDVRPKELVDIKSCNYLFNIMALEDAYEHHFDDALFYDRDGIFTECTTANFIWFDDNHQIYSVPFKNNCLPGITLTLLIEALKESEIKFQWNSLTKDNLNLIAGCAILSSTRLILPVRKIDNTVFSIEKHADFFKQLNELLRKKLN